MQVYFNEKLKNFVSGALSVGYKERFLLKELHEYMESRSPKVCCLYGLRRTGKTIMTLQEIKNLNDYEHCLYIRCEDGDTMWQLRQKIEEILDENMECKYIFVDEVTKAKGFVNTCSFFADAYSITGKRVVLAGTDSLGFLLANSNELFDRALLIHTTYIPFKEYQYLLGHGILDYIKYGGTLTDGDENVFYNNDRASLYTNSAIVQNISNTLKWWNDGNNYVNNHILKDVAVRNELPSIINKVLEIHNRLFLAEVINGAFESHDLGPLSELMSKGREEIADASVINTAEIHERIRIYLGIKKELYEHVSQDVADVIIKYLVKLDVLYQIPKNRIFVSNNKKEDERNEYIFTQVGMRYCQAVALADALIFSDNFVKYTAEQRDKVLRKLEGDILGKILEDIVFYQLSKELGYDGRDTQYVLSKYRNEFGKEIDLVVLDMQNKSSVAIEVKLSKKQDFHQTKALKDQALCEEIERKSGLPIFNKVLVYTGESSQAEDGVLYLNAEDFLNNAKEITKLLLQERNISLERVLNTSGYGNGDSEGNRKTER